MYVMCVCLFSALSRRVGALQITCTAEMPASADSKNKRVADSSPATHQTLQQQGGTGEDGYIHFADWTLSAAATEKKKEEYIIMTSKAGLPFSV